MKNTRKSIRQKVNPIGNIRRERKALHGREDSSLILIELLRKLKTGKISSILWSSMDMKSNMESISLSRKKRVKSVSLELCELEKIILRKD